MCSTPSGITALHTGGSRDCSRPASSSAQRLPASRPCIRSRIPRWSPAERCSTPSGITALHTCGRCATRTGARLVLNAFRHHGPAYSRRCGAVEARATRAQRLPASRPCILLRFDPRTSAVISVLNAFRHHGPAYLAELQTAQDQVAVSLCSTPSGITALHTVNVAAARRADQMCSTPSGITALHTSRGCFEDRATRSSSRRAQRLPASRPWIPRTSRRCKTRSSSAQRLPASRPCIPDERRSTRRGSRGAQRLPASRPCIPGRPDTVDGQRHVLNAFRHHGPAYFHRSVLRAARLVPWCSTPSGITALHTARTPRSGSGSAGAQRLPASRPCIPSFKAVRGTPTPGAQRLPASRPCILRGAPRRHGERHVLNAFRHHGPAYTAGSCATSDEARKRCSTPSGITALHHSHARG